MISQENANIIIGKLHAWFRDGSDKTARNTIAIAAGRCGFAVNPKIANKTVHNFLLSRHIDPNSTFYATWEDVRSHSRIMILIDQLEHYASTYGTDFEGEPYVPRTAQGEVEELPYDKYVVIRALEVDQLFDLCLSQIQSSVALKSDYVAALCEVIIELVERHGQSFSQDDLDSIKNKEAMCIMSRALDMFPMNDVIRAVCYMCTGKTQIVQGHMRQYYPNVNTDCLYSLERAHMTMLAKSFLRYKKFWMFLKGNSCPTIKKKINKIRRLAKKWHTPLRSNYWNNFFNLPVIDDYMGEAKAQVDALDNTFTIVKYINMIGLRARQNASKSAPIYIIRNGRVFMKEDKAVSYDGHWTDVQRLLVERLINILIEYRKKNYGDTAAVLLPTDIEYVLPTSEKTFYGNYPFGTNMKINNNGFAGVYWRNEWGTRDFDLSHIDETGHKCGWNSDFYHHGVTYSGDMTTADPEASEILHFDKDVPNGLLMLNRYSGEPNSKFELFMGHGNTIPVRNSDYRNKRWMVNPNDIKMRAQGISSKKGQIIGVTSNNKLYAMLFDYNEYAISQGSNMYTSMLDKARSNVNMRTALIAAGYIIADSYDTIEVPEGHSIGGVIDFREPTTDLFIKLMNGEKI